MFNTNTPKLNSILLQIKDHSDKHHLDSTISFVSQSTSKYTGETAMLVCRSTSQIWLWFKTDFLNNTINLNSNFNDNRFNLTIDNYAILDSNKITYYQSTLLITNINKNDFASYRCMNYGYNYADAKLIESSKFKI